MARERARVGGVVRQEQNLGMFINFYINLIHMHIIHKVKKRVKIKSTNFVEFLHRVR